MTITGGTEAGGFVRGNGGRRYRSRSFGTPVWLEVYSAQHRELTRECVTFGWGQATALGLALVQAATRSEAGRGSGRSAAEHSGQGRQYAASALGDGRVRLHIFSADGHELAGETFAHRDALCLGLQLIRQSGAAQSRDTARAA